MSHKYEVTGPEAEFEAGSRGRVLRNLLGITRVRDMNEAESQALELAQEAALNLYGSDHRFIADDICALHRLWLGPIYPWAGEYRSVNVSKGGFQFAHAPLIAGLMADLERDALRRHTPCRATNDADVAQALAEVHAELILVHPFRDGQRSPCPLARVVNGLAGGITAARLQSVVRARQARLYRGHSSRHGARLRTADCDVCGRYRAVAATRRFQCAMKASMLADASERLSLAKGARMPSTADDVWAEMRKAALRALADLRNGLDCLSTIGQIIRQ